MPSLMDVQSMLANLRLESRICLEPNALSQKIDDEIVILSLSAGKYFGLQEVGSFIWSSLQSPITIRALKEKVLEEFDVEEGRCEQDLLELLSVLIENKLVTFSNE
jgi:hypothetical protein